MLMDMFYSATEGIVKHRRRFHFHEVSSNCGSNILLTVNMLFAKTKPFLFYKCLFVLFPNDFLEMKTWQFLFFVV